MDYVYILDRNYNGIFPSLIMNELGYRGINFSNVETTKHIYYNNVLIYIPKVHNGAIMIFDDIERDIDFILKFRYKLLIFINHTDYINTKLIMDTYNGHSSYKTYESFNFNTTYSKIVADDCERIFNRFYKFHNKQG